MEPWLRPLYDADGMRAVDRWAIEGMGVPSLELMEAAGRAVAETVGELALDGPVRVVCGKGNNGGDGLVAARYLAEAGFEVEALLLWPGEELGGDAAANLERFRAAEHVGGDLGPRLADSGAIVDAIFGTDVPIIFAYHGYPWLIHRLAYRRTNHPNLHVRGYKEEGTVTTPFDMVLRNDLDRFHLVIDVIDRVPGLGATAAYTKQALRDRRVEHRQYIERHGEDMPEIRNWTWPGDTPAAS